MYSQLGVNMWGQAGQSVSQSVRPSVYFLTAMGPFVRRGEGGGGGGGASAPPALLGHLPFVLHPTAVHVLDSIPFMVSSVVMARLL